MYLLEICRNSALALRIISPALSRASVSIAQETIYKKRSIAFSSIFFMDFSREKMWIQKQLIGIMKQKLSFRYDRELAEVIEIYNIISIRYTD